jgi:hydroxyacylglutathione hydrolase
MKAWKTRNGYRIVKVLSGRSNVFLLTNGVKNILIDTSPASLRKLLERRLEKIKVKSIDYLILTHSHYDHSENAFRIKEKFKSKVIIHKDEASALSSGETFIPKGTILFSRIIVSLAKITLPKKFRSEPCKPDLLIEERFDLMDFGFNAYILHTPGHTAGSVSVIIDNEIAIVGDAMFGIFRGSIFPPFADDTDNMVTSWGKLIETGCLLFLPSHGRENKRSLVEKEYEKRIKRSEI